VLQRRQIFKCVMHGLLLGILLRMRLNTPWCGFRLYFLIHVWLVAMPLISIHELFVPIVCEVRVISGELASTLLKLSYYNCCLYFLLPLSWGAWAHSLDRSRIYLRLTSRTVPLFSYPFLRSVIFIIRNNLCKNTEDIIVTKCSECKYNYSAHMLHMCLVARTWTQMYSTFRLCTIIDCP
jgi:hypothetical protein